MKFPSSAADKGSMAARSDVQRGVIALEALAEACSSVTQQLEELAAPGVELRKLVALIAAITDYTNLLSLDAALECARNGGTSLEFQQIANNTRQQTVRIGLALRRVLPHLKKLQTESSKVPTPLAKTMQSCRALVTMASRTEELFHSFGIAEHCRITKRQLCDITAQNISSHSWKDRPHRLPT